MHLIKQHHVDQDALLALVAGPVTFIALAAMAIAVKDAPVAHAAHAALTAH